MFAVGNCDQSMASKMFVTAALIFSPFTSTLANKFLLFLFTLLLTLCPFIGPFKDDSPDKFSNLRFCDILSRFKPRTLSQPLKLQKTQKVYFLLSFPSFTVCVVANFVNSKKLSPGRCSLLRSSLIFASRCRSSHVTRHFELISSLIKRNARSIHICKEWREKKVSDSYRLSAELLSGKP